MDDRGHALEAHSGIDMTLRQRRKSAVGIGVELNENQIPDLDAPWILLIDEHAPGITEGRKIDV